MSGVTTVTVSANEARGNAIERWFYIGIAIATLLTVIAGFGPSMVDTSARKAEVSALAVVHGVLFLAWLLVFLAQTTLVATGRIALHRHLGTFSMLLVPLMIIVGYLTTISMVRRGFDLSGDLHIEGDAFGQAVFPLGDLVIFGSLVLAGYLYRPHPEVHKRLMVLATVGGLMPAPLAHIVGHNPALRTKGPIILVPIALFLFAQAVYDRIYFKRFHPVSLWVAIVVFVYMNILAAVVGPSPAWHRLMARLVQ